VQAGVSPRQWGVVEVAMAGGAMAILDGGSDPVVGDGG
jgi:hypothetical protein